MIGNVVKRIIRRPFLSLTGLLLACAMCFVLCFLVKYRSEQEEGLRRIRETYQILCTVTDARGVNTDGLRLAQRYVEFVESEEEGLAGYIKDLRITRELGIDGIIPGNNDVFTADDLEEVTSWQFSRDSEGNEVMEEITFKAEFVTSPWHMLLGLSDPVCSSLTDPARGGAFTSTVEDFFRCDEDICLVPESYYERLAGKPVTFSLYSPYSKGDGTPREGRADITVVGWYKGEGTAVLVPYACAQRIGYKISSTVSADSIAFFLNDNTKVDEMKEKAREVFAEPAPSSFSGRAGLVVKDSVYRLTMQEMEGNIRQVGRLIPVSLMLSLLTGLLTGYLTVRGETKTYALRRTLGVGAGRLILMVLSEQLLLPAVGALAVGLILGQLRPALIYFVCHAAGCLLAVLRPALTAPTKLLHVQE